MGCEWCAVGGFFGGGEVLCGMPLLEIPTALISDCHACISPVHDSEHVSKRTAHARCAADFDVACPLVRSHFASYFAAMNWDKHSASYLAVMKGGLPLLL